ncbi:MAG TPA: M28 family peptidase [Candidatus Limnocylindrales bacterium]|nr:M28 family peptidase [Candidatus Limnocylindrales bacterium]
MVDRGPSHWRAARWALAILGVAGIIAVVPPLPLGAPTEGGPDVFSAARAIELIERIAVEPRPIGSAANERARATIVDELERLGLEPELQASEASDWFGLADGSPVPVVNVLARIPGTASTGGVALVGHHDTVPTTTGANDDAAAVAVILEAARAIMAGPALRNDVILVLTDGEEPAPRYGATAFVAEHPWAATIGFVVNLEAIGSWGPPTLVGVVGPDGAAIDRYAAAVARPVASSVLTATRTLIGGSTSDMDVFGAAGMTGVELAYFHGSSIYHTPADALDRVDVDTVHRLGDATLAIARRVGNDDLGEPMEVRRTAFFTVGPIVVRHPAEWTVVVLVLAGLVLVAGAAATSRSGAPVTWSGAGRGLFATVLTMLVSAVAAVAAWTVVSGLRGDLGIAEGYLYLAGLVALVVVVHAGSARIARVAKARDAAAVGVVAAWCLLAAPLALAAPEIGYLLAWPALAAATAILLRRRGRAGGWLDLAAFALVAVTALVLVVPAVDTFFQFAQPRPGNPGSQLTWMVAIPAVLVALVAELVVAVWPRPAPLVAEPG